MNDSFDVKCNKCQTEVAFSVPDDIPAHPFTCPGCGGTLRVGTKQAGTVYPMPQTDTSHSPAPQHRTSKFNQGSGDS